jgi:hypothetical protein
MKNVYYCFLYIWYIKSFHNLCHRICLYIYNMSWSNIFASTLWVQIIQYMVLPILLYVFQKLQKMYIYYIGKLRKMRSIYAKSPIYSVPNFSSIANICGNVINSWNFISIHLASDSFVLGKHVFCVEYCKIIQCTRMFIHLQHVLI